MKKFLFASLLGFCVTFSGCALFQDKEPELPLNSVYEFFDEKDGALAKYIELLNAALAEGKISQSQYDIYMSNIEAVRGLVDETKSEEVK